jgi:hypothetical protein
MRTIALTTIALTALLAASSCTTAAGAPPPTNSSWCAPNQPPLSSEWAQIAQYELRPVADSHMRAAAARLARRNFVSLSSGEAESLGGSTGRQDLRYAYLVRTGIVVTPGLSAQEIARHASRSTFAVHRLGSTGIVAILSISTLGEQRTPANLPSVLRLDFPLEEYYAACLSMD